jgi:hypothetical protein
MATMEEAEIEDFLEGSFVNSFEDGETRVYEFDVTQCKVVSKNDFNGKPTKALRYVVRDPESMVQLEVLGSFESTRQCVSRIEERK